MQETDENGGAVIKEGFICPICLKDMRSPSNLLAHFQEVHREDQDLLKSFKDLVGKAKKRILKTDDQTYEFKLDDYRSSSVGIETNAPATIGRIRSHTDAYREIRRERLDHRTTETNKLIIRLDRLMNVVATSTERRNEERRIVTWLDGTNVTRCPSCAQSFNIARRQHHCRLCGSVMCHGCSAFLNLQSARAIVAPVHHAGDTYANDEDDDYGGSAGASGDKRSRGDRESLRVCGHCMGMIETRRLAQSKQLERPPLCRLYDQLFEMREQLKPSIDLYYKMHSSLTSGDTTFQLRDAQSLRASLAHRAESVDALAKRIQSYDDPTSSDPIRSMQLRNAIRRSISHYIKDNLLTLPALPTPEEYKQFKSDRLARYATHDDDGDSDEMQEVRRVAVTTGWSPAPLNSQDSLRDAGESGKSVDDPLLEQIRIVSGYVDQARAAHRYEEVASLEENLRMLEMTLKKSGRQLDVKKKTD